MPLLPDPDEVVLDTSALLAYLCDDAGADTVGLLLRAAAAGKVNLVVPTICLAEALSIALRSLGAERLDDFRATIEQLPVRTVALDLDGALDTAVAAHVWQMGYPEAAAATAAQSADSMLVTANPLFALFERTGGKVYWIGPEEERNEATLFDPFARFRPAARQGL